MSAWNWKRGSAWCGGWEWLSCDALSLFACLLATVTVTGLIWETLLLSTIFTEKYIMIKLVSAKKKENHQVKIILNIKIRFFKFPTWNPRSSYRRMLWWQWKDLAGTCLYGSIPVHMPIALPWSLLTSQCGQSAVTHFCVTSSWTWAAWSLDSLGGMAVWMEWVKDWSLTRGR